MSKDKEEILDEELEELEELKEEEDEHREALDAINQYVDEDDMGELSF
ncbi:MAG: hypothetical protein J6Y41_02940 [Bacteroidaceae bacterium]|nr:hypothetical protein [Bacteroidaceae bacterium]